MNEPTHNEQRHLDQHVLDLLNGSIDDELSAKQQAELDALLAGSERTRELNEELAVLSGILDGVPERDPPEYLHHAIVSQVRLPVPVESSGQKSGLFTQWLAAPWLRTGLAMTAGVILTVGIYQTGSESLSPEDAAHMTGTVLKKPNGELLDSTRFSQQEISGEVELRAKDGLFLVDVYLEADGVAVLNLALNTPGLEYEGINGLQDPSADVSMANGAITVTTSGQQHYELLLRSTTGLEKDLSGPLTLTFFADNVLVHEAELESSQK